VRLFSNFQSQVIFSNELPREGFERAGSFLLYDEIFASKDGENQELKAWIQEFKYSMAVPSGEDLKDFKNFPKYLELFIKKGGESLSRNHSLVVLGGGSLGDFGGFVASIIKRGVNLIQIPSTWLAAMDSAHGGKNGLNYGQLKNQLGTFYPAEKVFIVRPLLDSVPDEIKEQSYGELVKMGLVGSSQYFKDLMLEQRPALEFMWRFLGPCIEDKYAVVLQDPYETQEVRQVLNFGHTLGHVLEAHFGWSHGDSVLQGLFFALAWSVEKGFLSKHLHQQILKALSEKMDRAPATALAWYRPPAARVFHKKLLGDKKRDASGELLFVFLKNIGQPHMERVSVDAIVAEAQRQGWVR
jgi:3-dehydroquinate synthase